MAGKSGRGRPRKSSISLTSLLNFTVSESRAEVSKKVQGNSSKSQGSNMEQIRVESPAHHSSITPRSSSMVTPASEIPRNILTRPQPQQEFQRKKTQKQVWFPKEVPTQIPSEKEAVESCKVIPLHLPEQGPTENIWQVVKRKGHAVSGSSLLNYELPVKNGFTSLSGDD
ncbi:hypothetical protein HAX54_002639 [Datura stramonium]|uniref:Uncharacterized protein n=1 Tax=Datura stramonium TaxID=4076 RepID=A0ABS8T6G0_DATST|nr:hypothetical protein [Datura stramonium]